MSQLATSVVISEWEWTGLLHPVTPSPRAFFPKPGAHYQRLVCHPPLGNAGHCAPSSGNSLPARLPTWPSAIPAALPLFFVRVSEQRLACVLWMGVQISPLTSTMKRSLLSPVVLFIFPSRDKIHHQLLSGVMK